MTYPFLLMFDAVLWAAALIWYLRQPVASAFHPASHYFVFHGVLFVVRPILAWWLGFNIMYQVIGFSPSMAEKITVLLAADLGFLVFLLVSIRVGNLPFMLAPQAERGMPPRLDLSFWMMAAICTPAAIASLVSTIRQSASGFTSMVNDMESGMIVNTSSNGYFTDAALMLGPIVVALVWGARFRFWSLLALGAFVAIRASTGSRWPFVMGVINFGLLYMYHRRWRWPPARLAALALPLVLLFTIIGEDRGAGLRQLFANHVAVSEQHDYFQTRPLESMDYANLEFFEFIVHVVPVRSGTYDWFADNSRILIEPIPRVLWPGKPVGPPIEPFQLWHYGQSVGATNSVPGEGWKEAGWLGVALWSALFAWIYGRFYNWFVRSRQDRYQVLIFMCLTATILQCLRDGELLTVLKTSFFPVLPILVWRWCSQLVGSAALRAGHAFSP